MSDQPVGVEDPPGDRDRRLGQAGQPDERRHLHRGAQQRDLVARGGHGVVGEATRVGVTGLVMPSPRPWRSSRGTYWNDIGTLREYVTGNLDALEGAVSLDFGGTLLDGPEGDYELEGPVLLGDGATIGAGAEVTGPVVIGSGSRIGERAKVKEAVLLAGADAFFVVAEFKVKAGTYTIVDPVKNRKDQGALALLKVD